MAILDSFCHSLLPLVLLLSVGSDPALAADSDAADACAAKLDPDAKAIYDAALPSMKEGAVLKTVLTHVVMSKVMSGDLTRHTARPRAEEASACLELIGNGIPADATVSNPR
jgi:hypothetical protein